MLVQGVFYFGSTVFIVFGNQNLCGMIDLWKSNLTRSIWKLCAVSDDERVDFAARQNRQRKFLE